MKLPTSAVIVPVYNAAEHLPLLSRALFHQTVAANEIFFVDDGSSDNSVDILKKWAQENPDAGVLILEQDHRGPAAARNIGAKEASSEILLFIDSDCLPREDWVEKMSRPFLESEVAGVQGTYASDQDELIARFCQLEIEDRYRRMKRDKYIDFVGTYSAGYRREVFLSEGGFDDRFPIASGEDADLSYRLAGKGLKLVLQSEAVVFHQHPTTLKGYLAQKFWRAYWRNLLYRRHRKRMWRDSYTPQALKVQTVIGLLFIPSLAAPFLMERGYVIPCGLLLADILFSLPLSFWMLKRDPAAGLIGPIVAVCRSVAFAGGAIRGLVKGLWLNEDYL